MVDDQAAEGSQSAVASFAIVIVAKRIEGQSKRERRCKSTAGDRKLDQILQEVPILRQTLQELH